MLKSLSIKNYAIIEEVRFDFNINLNIITGETGAGKSIILGALNMVLGARADTKVLYDESRKCVVEADFTISEAVKRRIYHEDDFDIENDQILIRREINNKGKSRSFINDTPVTLNTLRKTGAILIDLHQQFDTMDINDANKQRDYVDAMAGNEKVRTNYAKYFQDYKSTLSELNALKNKGKQSEQELEYLNFQLNELDQADLDELNLSNAESEYQTLNNAEEIKHVLNNFSQVITNSDPNISEQLSDLSKDMLQLSKINPTMASIKERLDDVNDELLDIQRQSESLAEEIEYDENKILELKDKLDLIYSLQKKHKESDINVLIKIRENLRVRIERNDNLDEHIIALERKLKLHEENLENAANKLTKSRKDVSSEFGKAIEVILQKLSMPNARFEVIIEPLLNYEDNGKDNIAYHFSANKGIPLNPITSIASGGEMSRLALCIKSIIADKTNLPTMIFDEVDSGVSGQVALIMGALIGDLSEKYQIIAITHSPQVAAYGDEHFFIYKEDSAQRSYTRVKKLDRDGRINEIAQMLSGNPPTPSAITNAKELMEMVRVI
ncbi:MAG: DNA repair protein RecN [Saprospiraceae bacterium]